MANARRRKFPPAVMCVGTASNAGKSVLAAGLCRLLARRGYSVAPFKAQNMSLNSWVTYAGEEIGIAQAVQAWACGLEPEAAMNPVLLKPLGEHRSQLVVMGKPAGIMTYAEFVSQKNGLWETVKAAYALLAQKSDIMILEGAGSPAEINLRQHDIVNLSMCRHAHARGLLTADIDRGGAFAALAGTMSLLDRKDKNCIAAFVLNKFRGDASLLAPALEQISQKFRRPFLGVIPYLPNLGLPDEDSASQKILPANEPLPPGMLDAAIVELPAMSNMADCDPLLAEPGVRPRLVKTAAQLGKPHIVIIPGSRNVPACLRHLRETNLDEALKNLALQMRQNSRGQILGICAGLQILGEAVVDPLGLECEGKHEGLGLLPLVTYLEPHKNLRRQKAAADFYGAPLPFIGQEIHHGRCQTSLPPLVAAADGSPLAYGDGKPPHVWGTWLHGIFECDQFRHAWLNRVAADYGQNPAARAAYDQDAALDRLADCLEQNLDMELLMSWMQN